MNAAHSSGYSSNVDIWLEIANQCLDVAQVGDSSLILRNRFEIGTQQLASIIISVDGERRAYPVIVRRGVDRVVEFEHRSEAQAKLF